MPSHRALEGKHAGRLVGKGSAGLEGEEVRGLASKSLSRGRRE